MALWLKQSTAYTFRLGPFVDDTDGKTAETALTLTQADFRLSKAGGAFAQKNETTSGTHDENGYYTCILNTTDTGTLGTLDIHVNESGALPVFKSFLVVPANVYDSFVAGSDLIDVSVVQNAGTNITSASGRQEVNMTHIAGSAVSTTTAQLGVNVVQISGDSTSADNLESYTDGTTPMPANVTQFGGTNGSFTSGRPSVNVNSIATDAIDAASIKADAVTEIQTGLATLSGLSSVNGTVLAILADTGTDIPASIAALDTKLDTIDDFVDTEVSAIKTVTDKLDDTLVDSGGGAYIFTVAALANGPSGSGASAATIADAVWDEVLSGHTTTGTAGKALADAALGGGLDAAGVRAAIGMSSANLDTQLTGINTNIDANETKIDTVDTVLDALVADIGSNGSGLTALPWNSAWDAEVQSEAQDAITASGLATATNLATVDTVVDAIKVTTDKLDGLIENSGGNRFTTKALEAAPAGGAGLDAAGVRAAIGMSSANMDTQLSTIDTVVDAIKVKTDGLTYTVSGVVDANIQRVNDIEVTGNGETGTEWGPA